MNIKRYAMAGGVLATAAAIGFVMQNGQSAKARYAQVTVPDITGTTSEPMQVTDITLTSALSSDVASEAETEAAEAAPIADSGMKELKTAPVTVRTAALGSAIAVPEAEAEVEAENEADVVNPACDVEMSAEPVAAAMVLIEMQASCYPNERVTFHHNGMMFTYATDETGGLEVTVPALAENAVFIAAFANGEGALANAKIDTLEFYDRLVVQSKASSALHINAFEFGADFRDRGHVSATSDHTMADAATGSSGFVTTLGNEDLPEALVAEIYTYPTATSKQLGEVHVSVDAEVTIENCGLRVEAQTLEVRRGSAMKVQDLTLPIPACDAVGDFLVLQNLLQDLKVARN